MILFAHTASFPLPDQEHVFPGFASTSDYGGSSDEMPELPGEVKLCLFRIAQEAISNAVKHGHVRRIDVFLRRQEDCFSLQVRDDGIGFDLVRPAEGLGLASMRERLDSLA